MKRMMAFALTLLLVGVLCAPGLVDASSTDGSGGSRDAVLTGTTGTNGNVTATVDAPTYIANYTNVSLQVAFANADWVNHTYVVNWTLNGTTYTTGAVAVEYNGTATGYVNITADTFAVANGLNLTISLMNDTYVQEDVWYGELNTEDIYGVTSGTIIDLMIVVVAILAIMMVFQFMVKSFGEMQKKM